MISRAICGCFCTRSKRSGIPLDAEAGVLRGGRRGDEALAEIPIPPEKAGGWRVEADFIAAIRGQQPVTLTTFADGVRYMDFTEAVALSAAEGRAVSLPLL